MMRLFFSQLILLLCCTALVFAQNSLPEGAYYYQNGTHEETLVFVDGYFSYSAFDKENKTFSNTWGGPYKVNQNRLIIRVQFNADHPTTVGSEKSCTIKMENHLLITTFDDKKQAWKMTDHNDSPLAGVWRITGRRVDGKMNEMPLRDRRTLKILTGKRFQWVAINIKSGEFSGTGGGTYSFKDQTYTEHIEFFSRDGNRVGASLSFTGKVENGQWHHSGLSSKGDPIYEIWSKSER